MNWVQLGGSIVAILVLSAVAWGLKLGGIAPLDDAGARRVAEDDLSGFSAAKTWLSTDRHRAVVLGQDGSVALIRPHGAHHVVRRVSTPLPVRQGQFIEIDPADRRFGSFSIQLADQATAAALARDIAAPAFGR